jgi:hypothetical protein
LNHGFNMGFKYITINSCFNRTYQSFNYCL